MGSNLNNDERFNEDGNQEHHFGTVAKESAISQKRTLQLTVSICFKGSDLGVSNKIDPLFTNVTMPSLITQITNMRPTAVPPLTINAIVGM